MKSWYKSKMFWFNVLALILAIAEGFGFSEFEPSPEIAAIAFGIVAVVNVVLRTWFTGTRLTK